MSDDAWVIICAAGTGRRASGGSDTAKQYRQLAGKSVLAWSLEAMHAWNPAAINIVIVCDDPDVVRQAGVSEGSLGVAAIVRGGQERTDSVMAGLAAVPDDAVFIAVHDAARPLASASLLSAGLELLAQSEDIDGVVPGLPIADTVKVVDSEGTVLNTPPRSALVRVQTPQVFRAQALRNAYEQFVARATTPGSTDSVATDDASVVERSGGRVVVFPGDPDNLKITYPLDFELAELLLHKRTLSSS